MDSSCDIRALVDLLGAHPTEFEDFDDEQKVEPAKSKYLTQYIVYVNIIFIE